MIDLLCGKCGETYHADEQHVGQSLRCVRCGELIPIVRPQVSAASKLRPQEWIHDTAPNTPIRAPWFKVPFVRQAHKVAVAIACVAVLCFCLFIFVLRGKNSAPQNIPLDATSRNPSLESPLPPARPPQSLQTGTQIIEPVGTGGLGSLKVVNGTTNDAVVKLKEVDTKVTFRFVYVKSGDDVLIEGISLGRYDLQFCTGTDWENNFKKFLRDRSFSRFAEPVDFTEQETASGRYYHRYEVTLHPVPHGKAHTASITETEFDQDTPLPKGR